MIDIIKNQRLLSFIIFLVFFFFILLIAQWNLAELQFPIQVYSPIQNIFYHLFNNILDLNTWFVFTIKICLIIWQAALVNQIFRGQFLNQQHWMTFIIYCLFILIFHDLSKGLNSFVVCLIFVYLVKILLEIPSNPKPYKEVFDVFFLNSVLVLLEPGCVVFYVFLSLVILLFRPFNIYEFIIGSIGLLIPYVWILSYYFIFNKLYLIKQFYFSFINEYTFNIIFEPDIWVVYFLIIVGLVMTFAYVQNKYFKISVKNRIYFQLHFWLIAFCIIYFLISFDKSQNDLLLLSIPLAFIMSPVLLNLNRKALTEIYLLFLTLSAIEVQLNVI